MQGLEEAVYRNISACQELCEIIRTSLGPNGKSFLTSQFLIKQILHLGMNKMVINHLDKLFVTNDAATIMKELEIVHPAAKLLVLASKQQEAEMGDNTNFVIVFAGELLKNAEGLLKLGLKPTEIVEGYEKAYAQAVKYLTELALTKEVDFTSEKSISTYIKPVLMAKQYGVEDLLTSLVAKAATTVMPKNPKQFNVDNIRIVKIPGASLNQSQVVRGMIFGREPEGIVKSAQKAKVAIFTCDINIGRTEAKGTVLIHDAKEMLNFSKGEESMIEQQMNEIADTGVKVLVTGGTVGELAMHFLNRRGIMVVRVQSKFDLRRLCKVVGVPPLARLGPPTAEEMGLCDSVEVVEIGSDRCTVFKQETEGSQTASIVLRGSTMNFLDDIERAIEDGVNVVKALAKESKVLAGAGASDIEVARKLAAYGQTNPGLAQYSIKKYAESFEVIPRTLATNSGMDGTEVISKLYAAHQSGKIYTGVNVESDSNGILDAVSDEIFDALNVKLCALALATQAALTVLRIDQIIMSKPAGGPKPHDNGHPQDED